MTGIVTVNGVALGTRVARNGADELTTKGLREPATPAILTITG
jgi:hypothetical protein